MEIRMELGAGIGLTAIETDKFKTGCFSINFFRPLRREEAAMNALIPSVLLRGSERAPDLRAIAARLDELYGASVGSLVRKKGEVQMTGFYADFVEDAFVGEAVFAEVMDFVGELLLRPRLEGGHFLPEYVEGEKRNLANAIASRINDKRSYATSQLLKAMCAGQAYAVPRLGELEDVEPITAEGLYAHYCRVLRESRVELFYMGCKRAEDVAACLKQQLSALPRAASFIGAATAPMRAGGEVRRVEACMDVTQGKLSMGFTTDCVAGSADYPALLTMNTIFGGGITSKLFCKVREELSLCYYAASSIEKFKGLMVVSSGVEFDNLATAEAEILRQLDECRKGNLSDYEFDSARRYLLSDVKAALDSPGRLDDYAMGQRAAGLEGTMADLGRGIEAVTREAVAKMAARVRLDTIFTLRGLEA